jgi:hypothetical protein
LPIQIDEKVHGLLRTAIDALQSIAELRPDRFGIEKRRQILREPRLVGEGIHLGGWLEEEVERVDHRQLGDEINVDHELARLLGKHDARKEIAVRILLPVEELRPRLGPQRVAEHRRTTMRRRPQTDDMRRQRDRPVVAVSRRVGKRDVNGHAKPLRRDDVGTQARRTFGHRTAPGEERVLDVHADLIHLGLQAIQVFVQTAADDLVHLRVGELGAEQSEELLRRASEHGCRRTADGVH